VNAAAISMSMSISNGSLDLNWALQRSQTPMAGGVRFAIRNLRFGMIAQSSASGWEHVTPVDLKLHLLFVSAT
jgi:hypothetical protein